jgi:tricorn protease interacting factor F2/3
MVIVSASSNPFARPILWDWLVRRWSGVVAKVGQGNPLLGRIVSSVVLTVDSSMEGTIRRFFRENPAPGTERALDQALEWVRINDGFLDGIRSDGGA